MKPKSIFFNSENFSSRNNLILNSNFNLRGSRKPRRLKYQPETIVLYKKNGYNIIPNYGQYIGVENSVCFEKIIINLPGLASTSELYCLLPKARLLYVKDNLNLQFCFIFAEHLFILLKDAKIKRARPAI